MQEDSRTLTKHYRVQLSRRERCSTFKAAGNSDGACWPDLVQCAPGLPGSFSSQFHIPGFRGCSRASHRVQFTQSTHKHATSALRDIPRLFHAARGIGAKTVTPRRPHRNLFLQRKTLCTAPPRELGNAVIAASRLADHWLVSYDTLPMTVGMAILKLFFFLPTWLAFSALR